MGGGGYRVCGASRVVGCRFIALRAFFRCRQALRDTWAADASNRRAVISRPSQQILECRVWVFKESGIEDDGGGLTLYMEPAANRFDGANL
jgi:hypothetical protein